MSNVHVSFGASAASDDNIIKNIKAISDVVEEAISSSLELLGPVELHESISIVVYSDKGGVIPEDGTGGFTLNANLVNIYINPEDIQLHSIYSIVCHELTHAKRFSFFPTYDSRLVAGIISEGIAVAFEEEVKKPNYKETFFIKSMKSRKNTQEILELLISDLFIKNYNFKDNYGDIFISGNKSRGFPRWAGYEVGYYLVRQYISRTGKKPSELVATDTDTIIEKTLKINI